ncbi:cbb3-type cytochrome oxidase assembly protein CcoS [Rhizobium straminoryzae]|uniref:Cbb3-type cytochrome oxidase assembly protein CcoS n=1 Tax=Rhizobium straminoryzae TaxID=1387186 RepID=A0A549T633_9HYPH|nr:cbb3-type cytochrome oxidase assembly protein CcoS [Rhizobium straminoryzae]TRL37341.1 cbb3-type cytochrome oxidase assembly protein CcoS [Rhizobium straminoryzae]
MADALFLVPLAVVLSAAALIAFLWSLADGQYDDLAGAAERVIHEDREHPLPGRSLRNDIAGQDGG